MAQGEREASGSPLSTVETGGGGVEERVARRGCRVETDQGAYVVLGRRPGAHPVRGPFSDALPGVKRVVCIVAGRVSA